MTTQRQVILARLFAYLAIVGLLAFLAMVQTANAQEPRTATIEFQAPTEYTDGTPIAEGTPISYRVYQGERGGSKTLVGEITETQTVVDSGLERGREYCWHVTAVVGGEESAPSNEGCKAFRVPQTVIITVR